jgi:threonyl-tRNA synthetase
MITLALHVDYIKVKPMDKAFESAEELNDDLKEVSMEEALVVFLASEVGDSEDVVFAMVKQIKEQMERINCKNVLVYPYVHLTDNPSNPSLAYSLTIKTEEELRKLNYNTKRAPFGWYKSFELKVKGHPLSELSKRVGQKEAKEMEVVSESLKQEDLVKSQFKIMDTNGELIDIDKFDFSKHPDLRKFANYEIKKSRVYEKEPGHIALMREHDIAGNEPGSDVGNLRWLPKGKLIKKLIERHITDKSIENGAVEVETPLMYDFQHPALEKYLNRFPARQYIVLSDKKKFFLRFAACFGQFLISRDMHFSYKNLPLKMFELTRYSFRREQSGEVTGLRRLRAFSMPDMHTLTKDLEQSKQEFAKQFEMSMSFMKDLELEFVVAFRIQKEWYEQNKKWYSDFVKLVGKPMLIEMFDIRYAYFITKFEFNFVDSLDKCSSLSTVQIDVENAERFDIKYVNEDNEKKFPYILHASISGAVERDIYAVLEKQSMIKAKGETPQFPLWLAPTQLRLIPVSEDQVEYCESLLHKFKGKVRVDYDDRGESLGKKIRQAGIEWVPYVAVIGKKEIETGKLNVKIRGKEEALDLTVDDLIGEITTKTSKFPFEELSLPKPISKRFSF